MAATSRFKVGQLIELSDGRQCVIRFVGQTSFAQGDWVGVEFEDASGKNDGSVQGERYFECDMGHGMFLKPTGVAKVLEEPTPKPPSRQATKAKDEGGTSASDTKGPPKPASRPSTAATNATRRQTTADPNASKRAAMNSASPTPGLRRQTLLNGPKSPTKLATRAVGSTATSSAASSRGVTPPNTNRTTAAKPVPASRSSLAPRTTKTSVAAGVGSSSLKTSGQTAKPTRTAATSTSRTSVTGAAVSSTRSTNNSSSRLSHAPASKTTTKLNGTAVAPKKSSTSSTLDEENGGSEAENEDARNATPNDGDKDNENVQDPEADDEGDETDSSAAQKPAPSVPPLQPAQKTAALNRKVEEYEAKIRILEKKRSDDVEKLANLEKLQGEKDKLERIVQTLQTKMKPQSQDLSAARSKIKELEEQIEKNEAALAEHESEMEMAMLDREMAEETAESLKMELDALKQQQEELELEVEVLRDENAEFGKEVSPEEQSSRGWLQLERQNERYREALVRLRDVSQSTEAELKDQISALQEDLRGLDGIKEQYDDITQQLRQSEEAIEDLKQQLEAALASEDMVEELTEANNNLNEENRKLKVEVDELQVINELNDEFEQQRIENEKQMQEEIDSRGAVLMERANLALKQDEKLAEYEYTINKFRDVVTSLHSHIEDLKASQQISDAEADELNLRSKAMTDLNMRLQSSAAKAQIDTVDLEMRRLEAQEASEHLAIVQMFLPDGFKQERDSVLVYLRFQRVSFKAHLLCDLLGDRVSAGLGHGSSEGIFIYCEVMDKLAWVSAMCDRFVSDIRGCSLERFSNYERALPELDPVERALNGYIDMWKKGDMKEARVSEELSRTISLLTHLSQVHMEENLAAYADDIYMRATLMQRHLETTAAALTLSKSIVQRMQAAQEEPEEDLQGNMEQIDSFISQARGAKVTATKIVTTVDEIRTRSMSMNPDTDDMFAECLALAASSSSHTTTLGTFLFKASDDTSGLDEAHQSSIGSALNEFRASSFPDSSTTADPLSVFGNHLRNTSSRLSSLNSSVSEISNATEFTRPPAPWILRAEALTSSSQNNISAEAELQRLKDVLHERITVLRTRDQELEEQRVKIELLEARMRDANSKAKRIEELQGQADGYKRREREMMQEVEKKFREAESLKVERDRWKTTADQRQIKGSYDRTDAVGSEKAVASMQQMETLRMEIKGLQSAVKYLREDNRHRKQADFKDPAAMAWLREPLFPGRARPEEVKRHEEMEKEGGNLFRDLIYLTTTSRMVDLGTLPKNKLTWRPAREKTSWAAARQSEEWEAWNRKRTGFVSKAQELAAV